MKSAFTLALLPVAAACLFFAAPARADDPAEKPLTRAETEALIKKVIADNPDLIVKSVESYQMKQQMAAMSKAAQNIVSKQGDLQNGDNAPMTGNPKGDVTLVEFFDYHCGYCKHFFGVLTKLLDEDKNVRVVFREFPILSEDSETASKAALAVNDIDKSKYFAFHTALMKSNGTFDMKLLAEKAKEVGISEEALKKAMENPAIQKELDHNKELAQELNISGTPTIIIDTQLMPGAVDLDTLKQKIDLARSAAKNKPAAGQ